MIFVVTFFLNAATNFGFGISLSAILGPAEFGRFSTVQFAAVSMAVGMFDWLRVSTLRFAGDPQTRASIAASLEASYMVMTFTAMIGVGLTVMSGYSFGLGALALMLTPLLSVASHRVDFLGARFRAQDDGLRFASLYGARQILCYVGVLVVAYFTRSAALTIGTLVLANAAPAAFLSGNALFKGSPFHLANRDQIKDFLFYAKPLIASSFVYQLVGLINRHIALTHLGAVPTGQLSLAADLGARLFGVVNTLPELLLFQAVLRLDRTQGRAAAEARQSLNIALALAFLVPVATGYAVMAPTIECILVPAAYRGPFASVSVALAPGYLAQFAISTAIAPLVQLQGQTWRLTVASLFALALDVVLVYLTPLATSIEGLALAQSLSFGAAMAASIVLIFSASAVRPRPGDLVAVAVATLVMAALIHPLNAWSSPPLAALASALIGGVVLSAFYWTFDVGGLKTDLLRRFPQRTPKAA